MKKLSVIVPVYNVGEYLDRCIRSLLGQTLDDMEIIIINDGSTDSTKETALEYQKRYPQQIVVKTIKNSGAGQARNEGLGLAKGEYIGFVDGDDYVCPTMFEKLYDSAHEADADIACCGYRRIDGADIQIKGTKAEDSEGYGTDIFEQPEILVRSTPYLWNKIFRRTMLETYDAKFESLRIYEDLVFTYQMFLRANCITYVAQPLYYYMFSRGGSLTFRFSEKRFDLMPAFRRLYEYYKTAGHEERFADELLFILLKHVYVVCEEDTTWGTRRLKLRFVRESFEQLAREFPGYSGHTRYYEFYGNSRKLYRNKGFWYFRTLIPQVPRMRARLGRLKRSMRPSIAGIRYLRAYQKEAVKKNRILVQSQQGNNLNGNMFYLLKELCANPSYSSCEIGIAYAGGKKAAFEGLMKQYGLERAGVTYLQIHSKEYLSYLASAEYLFNDTSYATYYIKKKGQKYFNTWHGTPLKTLGKSTAKDYFDIGNLQKTFMQSDVLLYPSSYMCNVMRKDYMLYGAESARAWLCGYPRNEIFFSKERAETVKKELLLEGKQVIAYMPTWRGTVRLVTQEQSNQLARMLQTLDEGLRDDQILYVNLHPYVEQLVEYSGYRHIRRFPGQYETYDMLNACDVLVTDYSSVFFDYAVSKNQVILFAYDKEEYLRERGMYIDMDTLPFPQVRTVEELLRELSGDRRTEPESLQKFQETYAPYERAAMSADICRQFIFGEDARIRQERLDDGKRENVLIMAGSFEHPETQEHLPYLLQNSGSSKRNYYVTYTLENIAGNQEFLQNLPDCVYYMGTMNRFWVQSLWESFLMAQMEKRRWVYPVFRKRIDRMMQTECRRSWQGLHTSGVLAFGQMQIRDLAVAANLPGRRVIYFDCAEAVSPVLPVSLLRKFDRIAAGNEGVRDAVKRIKGSGSLKVEIVEDPESLEQLYQDGVIT